MIETGLIDADHLADLTAVLGEEQVALLVDALIAELAAAPALIAASVAAGDTARTRAAAHGLRGAAAGVGCEGVADLAGRLEAEPLSRSLADSLRTCAARTVEALSAGPDGRRSVPV